MPFLRWVAHCNFVQKWRLKPSLIHQSLSNSFSVCIRCISIVSSYSLAKKRRSDTCHHHFSLFLKALLKPLKFLSLPTELSSLTFFECIILKMKARHLSTQYYHQTHKNEYVKRKWIHSFFRLAGASNSSFPILTILPDFLAMKGYEIPISWYLL